MLAAIWQVKGIGSGLTIPEQFARTHSAYISGEIQNLQLWNSLALRAGAGSISDAELGQRFERDILPFWQTQKDQLGKENETVEGPGRAYALLVANFVDLRFQWAVALIDATKNHDSNRAADALKLMAQTEAANARSIEPAFGREWIIVLERLPHLCSLRRFDVFSRDKPGAALALLPTRRPSQPRTTKPMVRQSSRTRDVRHSNCS